jgi:hypothetical protein
LFFFGGKSPNKFLSAKSDIDSQISIERPTSLELVVRFYNSKFKEDLASLYSRFLELYPSKEVVNPEVIFKLLVENASFNEKDDLDFLTD